MKKIIIVQIVLLLLCSISLSSAGVDEMGTRMPRIFGTFSPQVGVWSKYAILEKNTGRQLTMTMSIVGQDGDMYWYEVVNLEEGKVVVVKMLVKGDPNDPENIQRLIIKSGNNPAQEMPMDFVMMGRRMADHMFEKRSGIPNDSTSALKFETIGKSQVTVQAGSFEVVTNRIIDATDKVFGTYNFCEKVKPFGVVTSDTQDSSMELLAYGAGGKSLITEKPLLLERPPGMNEDMPQGLAPGIKNRPEVSQ
ncbi:MAG: hypothetical protein KKB30_03520 [Proteobacteria bacterium]|nr:hypothetical protein [Pseudomonadota bacterium]MBU1715062.1 hypothetical protein [Pseudomonadota bacterium]